MPLRGARRFGLCLDRLHCFDDKGTKLMMVTTRRAAILLCSVAMVAASSSAFARPVHKSGRHAAQAAATTVSGGYDSDPRFSPRYATNSGTQGRQQRTRKARAATAAAAVSSGFTTNALVAEARKYLGTNPTGRASLWCGAFMDLVLKRTGHAGGGNLAKGYANYGRRVSGPQVGAIAVMNRRGGGHVGVVSGIDPNGNPIIISGNHNRTTAESVYPASRITAYVMPEG
jgi:uncharacterized protein (TIGR02594 family)